jgi:hypothetical protein
MQGVTPEELMYKTNLCGLVLLIAGMQLSGTLRPCFEFSVAQPTANVNLVLCALTMFFAVYCMTRCAEERERRASGERASLHHKQSQEHLRSALALLASRQLVAPSVAWHASAHPEGVLNCPIQAPLSGMHCADCAGGGTF